MEIIVDGLEKGDGAALWAHWPPSLKSELSDLVGSLKGRTDPRVCVVADHFLAEAGEALETKRSLLAQLEPLREGMAEPADRALFAAALVDAVRALGRRRALAPGADLAGALDEAAPAAFTMAIAGLRSTDSSLVAPWRRGPYRIELLAPGRARYVREGGGSPASEVLVAIDGRWVPEAWVLAWRRLAGQGARLVALEDHSPLAQHSFQIARLLNQSRARLEKVRQAQDPAAFENALSLVNGSFSLAIKWAVTLPSS